MNKLISSFAALAILLATPSGVSAQTRSSTTQNRSTSTATSSRGASDARQVTRSSNTSATKNSNASATKSSAATRSTSAAASSRNASSSAASDPQVRRSTNTGTAASGSTGSQTRSTTTGSTGSQTRSTTTGSTGSQTRSTTTGSQTRNSSSGSSTVRSASGSASGTSSASGTTVRSSSSAASGSTAGTSAQQVRRSTTSASSGAVSANNNVTSRGLSPVTQQSQQKSAAPSGPAAAPSYKVENHNVVRIPPRERGFMDFGHPGKFWGPDPHYFGWRIEKLPPKYKRVRYFGIDYYLYNNVYYRSFGGHYIICRPPVGIVIDLAPTRVKLGPVTFSFYHNVYRTYSGWDSYSRYIDQQNRIIAQNNATIAAQNAAIAMNLNAAQSSYAIASQLGLAQSYAYANQEYYYDDGVFYIINGKGRYEVIVPPAGALVDRLPEDYDIITMGGHEYYRVDDTVYRMVMVGGDPCLEVLGQMYGDLARKYSYYL